MSMYRINLDSVDSTYLYADANASSLPSPTLISAQTQIAGRGQRGNVWISEPGKNLTITFFSRPQKFPVNKQFFISEAFSLAIIRFLRQECGINAMIKWPNDILVNNHKICGILIKHASIGSEISYTIAGAGININQTIFDSERAPGATSARILTGCKYQISALETAISQIWEEDMEPLFNDSEEHLLHRFTNLHTQYMNKLWRNDGLHYPFTETSTGRSFWAKIAGVEPMGHLLLNADNEENFRRYAFKEIIFNY